MTNTKSGLILMAVGVGMNLLGWLSAVVRLPWLPPLAASFLLALLMLASVVVFFFGLFRLITGLVSRKKQAEPTGISAGDETVWPPAPRLPTPRD